MSLPVAILAGGLATRLRPITEDIPKALISVAAAAESPKWLRESDAAAMCYTTGTTGKPKGVLYSHRAIALHSLALSLMDTFGISHHDVVLPVVRPEPTGESSGS